MASGTAPHLTPWRRLTEVLSAERGELWVVIVYALAVGLLSLVVPIAVQALVNTSAFGTVLQPVVVLSLVVVALLSFAGVLRIAQVIVAERIQQRIFARMAIDLAHRLPRVYVETYDRYRGPELVNRFMDVMTIQKASALILMDGFALVLQAAIGMALLAVYSPILLGFDVLLLGGMTLVLFGLGRGAVRTSVTESYRKYEVIGWLQELARVPLAFKGAAGQQLALARADEATQAYLSARRAHFRLLLRQIGGSVAVQVIASGLLLGLGGWLVSRQQLSLGQLVAAELIVTPVVGSFAKFGKHLESFYDLLAAVDKVGTLFDLPLEPPGKEPLPPFPGPARLRLRALTYGYGGQAKPLFKDVDLLVQPGERLALVGAHSAGKSTLVDLALALRAPHTGSVEYDGVDWRELSLEAARGQIALVRGIGLFEGTLLENVRVGREELSLHDVRKALEAVRLVDELAHLPEGLNTRISGNQSVLSTGQAQRLMLARAIVGRPRLLVLDEALDNLGADVRGPIIDTLMDARAPWTLLLTTHVETLAERCTRVVRLVDGALTEVRRS